MTESNRPAPPGGSLSHGGRNYIHVDLAERATQTHIDVLIDASRVNGIHLPEGERYDREWASIPALIRFTGAAPRPSSDPRYAGSPADAPGDFSLEDESVLIRRVDAIAAVRQSDSGSEALQRILEIDLAGIDRPRLVKAPPGSDIGGSPVNATPYPTTSDAVNSRPTPGVDDTDPRTYPLDPR